MSKNQIEENEYSETSSSSEEDENANGWTEEIDKTFLKTLSSLKRKDPKIYDENVKFFDNEIITPTNRNSGVKDEKPLNLRDYERKIILEKNGILTDEDSDEIRNQHTIKRVQSPTYVQEQKTLKENFKILLEGDNEMSDNEENCAGFLKIKTKTSEEKAMDEEEYIEWLKGQKVELKDKQIERELKYLHDYWIDPNLNEREQFLKDYILNKRYLESDQNIAEMSEVSFSEEERILENCDAYEQKYNFRFEEPDQNFIKTYPRVIENSLRRKDKKRKLKREERKKRKEKLLEQKRIEVKKLKKQKKFELMEKIKKMKELTGNKELGFNDSDLQNDFSPNEYDKKMQTLFNEEFYSLEDDCDNKPQFSDLDSVYESSGNGITYEDENIDENSEYRNEHNINENNNEDLDLTIDCDYDPNSIHESKFKKQTRSSLKKGHKKFTSCKEVQKNDHLFNPPRKTYQKYVDELYELEFEDVIGDLPCRYKYRKVTPNDFGLSVEEILAADDKELNNWCSMKKIDTIRPENMEKFDLKIYSRKGKDINLKKKILCSLFKDDENTETVISSSDVQNSVKRNQKKEKNPSNNKFKSKPQNSNKNNNNFEITDERLKAYGLNPKRYRNKLKYGSNLN